MKAKRTGLFIGVFMAIYGLPNVAAQQRPATKTAIRFVTKSWNDVLALSQKLHKPIFMDAYAVWCIPCQDLKAQTFTDPRIAAYFNKHFINVAVDMEKGEGPKLADEYAIDSYPTLLFIDSNGKLIKKAEGFFDAVQLAKIASEVK